MCHDQEGIWRNGSAVRIPPPYLDCSLIGVVGFQTRRFSVQITIFSIFFFPKVKYQIVSLLRQT
jgi:hypothetical protein